MTDEIVRIVQSGDTYAAVQRVQRDGAPREVAERFQKLVRDLYWQEKHLPSVVAVAQGGIHYCLPRMESDDSEQREYFGSHAKGLAFNLGSFTWPGWAEPGITPSACDVAAGLDAAKLNLRLAVELAKPADRVQYARWLLGAHLLAAGDPAGALEQFQQCDPEVRPLFAGYVLLAQIVLKSAGAQKRFDEFLELMPAATDQDREFRSQLATAHRVFVG